MVSRRLRIFIWICVALAVIGIISTATVAFVVLRSMSSTPAGEAAAAQSFDEIRKLYPNRRPLIDIKNIQARDFQINRTPNAPRKTVDTIHFMYWDAEDQEIVRGEVPTWVSSMRISITGVGNWSFSDFHITREDIERYSPGLLIDFKTPDGRQVVVWTR